MRTITLDNIVLEVGISKKESELLSYELLTENTSFYLAEPEAKPTYAKVQSYELQEAYK